MPRHLQSFLFPDVNVWMALSFPGHVHHDIAREWFGPLDDRDDARVLLPDHATFCG
jgi:predicted nucleic acid-binding protein